MDIACTQRSIIILAAILTFCVLTEVQGYSLTAEQCRETVRTIGLALDTKQTTDSVIKGTWVSPRCESRRIQDAVDSDQKTAFLLRMIEIHTRRRWSGNYYFYKDKDCRVPMYGLGVHGNVMSKGGITLNITSVKAATYRQEGDKSLHLIYNQSCSGSMMLDWSKANTRVYNLDKMVVSQSECFKSLGVDLEEFGALVFQTHEVGRKKVVELLQLTPDLRKQKNNGPPTRKISRSQQWPLQEHSWCLTCRRVAARKLRYPPELSARNSSGIDGTWGSSNCRKEGRGIYTTRFDKFAGNTFERSVFALRNSKCNQANFGLRTVGTLREVSNSVEVPGGVVYEIAIKKAFLTVYSDAFARIFNINPGKCGKTTWEKGKTQDLGPTNGCSSIGYVIGPPELVLIRSVQDEDRNELYYGTDPYPGKGKKTGPVTYDFISQDCSKFPVALTTPASPVEITDPFVGTTVVPLFVEDTTTASPVEEKLANNGNPKSRADRIHGFNFVWLLLSSLLFNFI